MVAHGVLGVLLDGRRPQAPGVPISGATRGRHAELYFVRPAAPPEQPDEALLFLGDDQEGTRLEVVGVELAEGRLRVIHAMAMRAGYKSLYEEARTWQQ